MSSKIGRQVLKNSLVRVTLVSLSDRLPSKLTTSHKWVRALGIGGVQNVPPTFSIATSSWDETGERLILHVLPDLHESNPAAANAAERSVWQVMVNRRTYVWGWVWQENNELKTKVAVKHRSFAYVCLGVTCSCSLQLAPAALYTVYRYLYLVSFLTSSKFRVGDL